MTVRPYIIRPVAAAVAVLSCIPCIGSRRYSGGDISLLPEYEQAGARYLTHDGIPVAEVLGFLGSEGMNAMRVRLFVNPEDYIGPGADPNACQSLDYILPLCRRIKDAGMALMLDFHYSDTWADPGAQWTPVSWSGLDDAALGDAVYGYTHDVLVALGDAGVVPDFIQPGNEISYGMMWGDVGSAPQDLHKALMGSDEGWGRFTSLLRQAVRACGEVCPDARIVLHTERVQDIPVQTNFYSQMEAYGVPYDIIGLSYYPYFHGDMETLDIALTSLEQNFPDKDIMIVETGFPYAWEVPGSSVPVEYPYTDAGQNSFARELVSTLESHSHVTGLFWWWLEYNAYGTGLSGWYNAPLFDSRTGRACSALETIAGFAGADNGVTGIPADDGCAGDWFLPTGIKVEDTSAPGIYIGPQGKTVRR